MIRRERVVIAGGGPAGLSAAERLRESGWGGELVIIGEEPHRPYNRTGLSTGLLARRSRPAQLRLTRPVEPDAVWRTGTAVRGLDLRGRTVLLPGGERLGFDGLVIATGAEARALPGIPIHSPRVHSVRTLADAQVLDAALTAAPDGNGQVVIIGGGILGGELAATAIDRGLRVNIIEPAPTLLLRPLGQMIGEHLATIHRRRGVRLYLGTSVTNWHPGPTGVTMRLSNNTTLDADVVIVAVGSAPRTDWLHGSGLDITDGVACAHSCHALDQRGRPVEGVVAAGDVARWPNLRIDPIPRRVEHWINAIEMGQAAATALLAGAATAPAFTPEPRFWSHQHGIRIQSIGLPGLGTQTHILHGSLDSGRFVAGYTRPHHDTGEQVLIGVIGIDSPRAMINYTDRIGTPLPTPTAA